MKQVIVCGDSSMTPVVQYPGTHFAEIVSDKLNWNTEIFARGGMSNHGICLQIESAIKQQPDLIITNTTMSDRTEVQIDQDRRNSEFGVENIIYQHSQSVSTLNPRFNQSPRLMIDTIHYFLDQASDTARYEDLVDELDLKKSAVKQWFTVLYKNNWKTKTDRWCLYSALHQLHESGIPYLVTMDHNAMNQMCTWLDRKHYLQFARKMVEWNEFDPGYHTSFDTQKEIASIVMAHLEQQGYL